MKERDNLATAAVLALVLVGAALGFLLYRLRAGRKWKG